MKKFFKKIIFFIPILFYVSLSLIAQEVVSDLISSNKKRILLPEAKESLIFIIKSKPDTDLWIEFTADRKLFTETDKQTEDNFISNLFLTSEKVQDAPADKTVEKKFELTLEEVKALGQSKKKEGYKIYYRALVLGPEDEEGESHITHWSFSDKDWEKAPFVLVFKTHEAQMGYDSFLKGEEYLKKGEYTEAIEEYESAFFYFADPVFIYNIGICHLRLAIAHTEEFLEYEEISKENRTKAQNLLKRLRGNK
jgi:tetratricopeptide (TPR) repeat protein